MEVNTVKIISYSLFGDAPIYCIGALRNAEMAKVFYPDWTPLFWVEKESVPTEIIAGLLERGARVRPYSQQEWKNGMFVRFSVADDPQVERFLIRDVDSRPSTREVGAVIDWIESDKGFHIMRDHPWHATTIMGGLWGARGGLLKNVRNEIMAFRRSRHPYSRETQYGADQEFLMSYVWPKARTNSLIHDSFRVHGLTGEPFPDGLSEGDFVGSIFSEADEPNSEHRKVRDAWIRGVR